MRVTAIVLAGGRSSRFGGQKLAADLDGASLLDHVVDAVAGVADEVLLAGSPPSTRGPGAGPDVRTIPDAEAFGGPLAALAGALHAATHPVAIVAGGDMPGLAAAVLRSMLDQLASSPDIDAVLLEAPGVGSSEVAPSKLQVLPLALRVPVGTAVADAAHAAGNRSLVRLVARMRIATIPAAEWLRHDPAGATLVDIDDPEDLARWRARSR